MKIRARGFAVAADGENAPPGSGGAETIRVEM